MHENINIKETTDVGETSPGDLTQAQRNGQMVIAASFSSEEAGITDMDAEDADSILNVPWDSFETNEGEPTGRVVTIPAGLAEELENPEVLAEKKAA